MGEISVQPIPNGTAGGDSVIYPASWWKHHFAGFFLYVLQSFLQASVTPDRVFLNIILGRVEI